MNFDFGFNHIYSEVFSTDKRIIDIWGGRGRGGSYFGTDYFLFLITQPHYFRGYFVRQAFGDIRDSLFRDFKDRIEDNPTLDINDFYIQENEMRICYKPTGNWIMSKGVRKDGSRTAKMKSLAGATHVLIEEADELAEDDFDQLDLSLRTKKAEKIQVVRIFNPPGKTHWIWRDYTLVDSHIDGYFMAVAKGGHDILSIHSTYIENFDNVAASTVTKFERFKDTNPEYYYNIVLGLIPEGMKGRIYKGWQSMTLAEFTALEYLSTYALDFGYSEDPAALVELKKHNLNLYANELFYEVGLTNMDIAIRMHQLGIGKNDMIIADSAEPKSIAEFRRGWNVEYRAVGIDKDGTFLLSYPNMRPAIKGHGSIAAGITKVKEHTVHVTDTSTNLWVEYASYCWALDKEKNPTDKPIDAFNHGLDSIRMYCNTIASLVA